MVVVSVEILRRTVLIVELFLITQYVCFYNHFNDGFAFTNFLLPCQCVWSFHKNLDSCFVDSKSKCIYPCFQIRMKINVV